MSHSDPKLIERALGLLVCLACLTIGITAGFFVRASTAAGPLAQRHRIVAAMSPIEKSRLKRRHGRFTEKLNADQRQRMRDLHRELMAAKDAEALRDVMRQYHEWLRNRVVSPIQKDTLKRLAQEPEKGALRVITLRPLPRDDARALGQWARERIAPRLMSQLSEKYQRFWKDRDSAHLVWQTFFSGRRSVPRDLRGAKLTEEDVQDLAKRFSEGPRRVLENLPTLEDQKAQLRGWVWRRRSGGERSRTRETREDELVRFFMSDKLTDPQREQILSLPLRERNERLKEAYLEDKRSESAKRADGDRSGPPGRGQTRPGGPQRSRGTP